MILVHNYRIKLALILVGIVSTCPQTTVSALNTTTGCTSDVCKYSYSRIVKNMDFTADPCSDFHRYTCGGSAEPVPWYINMTQSDTPELLKRAMTDENLGKKPFTPPELTNLYEKMQSFYKNCEKLRSNETEALLSLKPSINEYLFISQTQGLDGIVQYAQLLNKNPLFRVSLPKDEAKIYLLAPFALMDDETRSAVKTGNHSALRNKISMALTQIVKPLKLDSSSKLLATSRIINDPWQNLVDEVLTFKLALGKVYLNGTLRREETLDKLQKEASFINWEQFFQKTTVAPSSGRFKSNLFITRQILATELAKLIQKTEKRIITAYILTEIVFDMNHYLPGPYRTKFSPVGVTQPIQTCVNFVYDTMPDIVHRSFVDHRFSLADAIKNIDDLFPKLKQILRQSLNQSTWITPAAKQRAFKKLDNMTYEIPIRDFLNQTLLSERFANLRSNDSFFAQGLDIARIQWMHTIKTSLGLIKKQPGAGETPEGFFKLITETYYDPDTNMIHISPTGHNLRPWTDPSLPTSMNYGSLAQTFAHEFMHGFDHVRPHVSDTHPLSFWWDTATAQQYELRTQCLIGQFSEFTLNATSPIRLNGTVMLRENLADYQGLRTAWQLHHMASLPTRKNKIQMDKHAFTKDQLFFINFGQKFCNAPYLDKNLDPALRTHAPPVHRVNGQVRNMESFKRAFSCSFPLKCPTFL